MTFRFRGGDKFFDTAVAIALDRHGQAVTGHWTVTGPEGNDVGGLLSGTLDGLGADARFVGVVQWDSPAGDPGKPQLPFRCRGQAAVTGNAVQPLRWDSVDGFRLENCSDGPTDVVWVLNRS